MLCAADTDNHQHSQAVAVCRIEEECVGFAHHYAEVAQCELELSSQNWPHWPKPNVKLFPV
jgi:hypothetical protein